MQTLDEDGALGQPERDYFQGKEGAFLIRNRETVLLFPGGPASPFNLAFTLAPLHGERDKVSFSCTFHIPDAVVVRTNPTEAPTPASERIAPGDDNHTLVLK